VPIRFGGKARYTGMDVAFAVVHVATVCTGKVTRLDIFWDRADALEAVRRPSSRGRARTSKSFERCPAVFNARAADGVVVMAHPKPELRLAVVGGPDRAV
jgi:hypothetical protein